MDAFLNGKKNKTLIKERGGRHEGEGEGKKGGGGVTTLPTVRLDIELQKPTDHKTNELSYAQLLKGKTKKQIAEDPLDPFSTADEEDKLASIAKRFEEKYGTHRSSEQDLVDIGRGYDSGDSFVDDSELYEDYVPPTVDTVLGGFYVNTGDLEFKRTNNIISESTQSSDPPVPDKGTKPKLKKQSSHFTPKAILANKKLKRAKQQIASSAQRSKSYKKKLFHYQPPPLLPPDLCCSHTEEDMDGSDMEQTSTTGGGGGGGASETNASIEDESSEGSRDMLPRTLPSGLSPNLTDKILQLEEAISKDQVVNGKLSYKAKTSYDSKLVDIDIDCKPLRLKTRMAVFEYLAYKLGINRSSLSNRIKRIHKKRESGNLEGPMEELKKAIDSAMPPLLEKYNSEMEKYEAERKLLAPPSGGDVKVEGDDVTCLEENQETTPTVLVTANGSSKKLRRPSKRFHWTDEIKSLVFEVVQMKVEKELLNKNRLHSGEEIINKFLEGQVKPLWPKGWVQKRTLYKMTESVHSKLTQLDGQPKKATPQQSVKKEKTVVKKELLYEGVSTTPTSSLHVPLTSTLITTSSLPPTSSLLSTSSTAVTTSIIGTPPSIKVGMTTSSITAPLPKVLSPMTTPPTSRSIALMNLQTQLSQLKSSNASLLNSTALINSPSFLTPAPSTITTPTTKATPTKATPPPLISNPVVLPVSLSSQPQSVITLSKGGKQHVIKKVENKSHTVANKGPSKVTKKVPQQNLLNTIPKSALEAILSVIQSSSPAIGGTGQTYTVPSNQGSAIGQVLLTPSNWETSLSSATLTTKLTTNSPPTHQKTPPSRHMTPPTHRMTPPSQHISSPARHVTPPIPTQQNIAQPTRRVTPPTHHATPPIHHATPPTHHATPPTQHVASPTQHLNPPTQHVTQYVTPSSYLPSNLKSIATTLPHALQDHPYITTTLSSSTHSSQTPPPSSSNNLHIDQH